MCFGLWSFLTFQSNTIHDHKALAQTPSSIEPSLWHALPPLYLFIHSFWVSSLQPFPSKKPFSTLGVLALLNGNCCGRCWIHWEIRYKYNILPSQFCLKTIYVYIQLPKVTTFCQVPCYATRPTYCTTHFCTYPTKFLPNHNGGKHLLLF